MKNAQIVILTADTDCDGTSYAAERVSVPQHRAAEFMTDFDALDRFLATRDNNTHYVDQAYSVVMLCDFLAEHGDVFSDPDDRAQFCGMPTKTYRPVWVDGEGWVDQWVMEVFSYTTLGANWNPWVHDDTIGIPALDTRYEDDDYLRV